MKDRYKLHQNSKFYLQTFLTVFFSFLLLVSQAEIDKTKWTEGKSLFKSDCAACHNPKVDGTGPALMGVTERWKNAGSYKGKDGLQYLHEWIHDWHDPVKEGYKHAIDMANSRPIEMNTFPNLKTEDIDNILLYVDNPDAFAPVAAAAPAAGAGAETSATESPSITAYLFIAFLVVLIAILLGVTSKLNRMIAAKNGEVIVRGKPFYKKTNFIVAMVLIAFVLMGYGTVDAVVHLGRQQGYQPTQPIRFSHALHAGKYKMDCQYCHQTANKGKNSNIPSLNTCMNCHKNVSKGPKYGYDEIAKIYDAVGWDSYAQDYTKPPKPVQWVRIDNLPDYVYFNHSQHVNVGKVQCQTCHGPVETMEEVYQYSPLSMGWCINCHRQTEVQFSSNEYYSTYKEIHEKLKDKKIDKVTVETIGGTECQRCHY